MMKSLCFYFQVHQPFRLQTYRFFDIGHHSCYFDEASNAGIMRKIAQKCYLPTNELLYRLIKEFDGQFKVSFSISGTAIDQFERYAPKVLESFQKLVNTGHVELLAETYAHSLAAIKSVKEFKNQVKEHQQKMISLFGVKPAIFRNTELIYNNEIGKMAGEMGFDAILTEGADSILGWRSPNFLYYCAAAPKLKVMLKNYRLSDDIAFRFSQRSWKEWPLNVDKYVQWLNDIPYSHEMVNLFMDYETFGEHHWADSGIFDFLRHLPGKVLSSTPYTFATPSELIKRHQPFGALHVHDTISWADESRDLTAWLGNELQRDAFDSLYRLEKKVKRCTDPKLLRDWKYLQTSDHFYYMCTKYFADGDVHAYFNPYPSPYEAFINYMNALSDFELQLNIHLKKFERKIKLHQPLLSKHLATKGNGLQQVY